MKPDQIWQTALGELQLQLTGATYNTWLGRTQLIACEDGTFIIGVHNGYAKDWLENRLLSMVKRTLTGITGRSVEVRFVVWNKEADAGPGGPLLQPAPAPVSQPALYIRHVRDRPQ
jgi:chromosomal replication initiator protein